MDNTELAVLVRQTIKTSSKSIRHNQKKISEYLALWGRSKIKLMKGHERKSLLRSSSFMEPIGGVTIWMDSSDFRISGKLSVSYSPCY